MRKVIANSTTSRGVVRERRYVISRRRSRAVRPLHAAIAEPAPIQGTNPVQAGRSAALSVAQVHKAAAAFKFNAREFADAKQSQPLIPNIRMYGELCECTYDNYLAVRQDGTTPIPFIPRLIDGKKQKEPSIPEKIFIAATGTQDQIDLVDPMKVPALPEELFLAPHPYITLGTNGKADNLPPLPAQYPYTAARLGGHYGFLTPNSPIIDAGFKVTKYLYASSGIFDSGDGPDEVYWIGYIAYSLKLKEIAVVFRGTVHITEWQQNADLKAIPITDKLRELKKDKLTAGNAENILMHQGFYEMYYTDFKPPSILSNFFSRVADKQQALEKQVKAGLLRTLDIIREAEAEDDKLAKKPFTLTVTGHSLGGALATVAAYDIVHDYEVAAAWPGGIDGLRSSIQGVTWAQPRVGNEHFVHDFNQKISAAKWLRILNDGDVVTMLPFHTLPVVREALDDLFTLLRLTRDGLDVKRQKAERDTLIEKAQAAVKVLDLVGDARDLLKEVKEDWIENEDGTKSCAFKHVGWELHFDPDHPKFDYVATTGHTENKVVNFIKSSIEVVAEFGHIVDDVPSFKDQRTRHNLDVLMHMLDPTMDKVLMNRKRQNLVLDQLSPDELARLGGKYSWWAPFQQNGMRLVKHEDDSYKWTSMTK